jgi:hypothetical protein
VGELAGPFALNRLTWVMGRSLPSGAGSREHPPATSTVNKIKMKNNEHVKRTVHLLRWNDLRT